ncbi:MAG: 1-(5-phosphoribosyl)-5-[(5-phosphoribosylamino)methylideneamino] imidazole-4-carboxamide isomerase [Candidatus Eisenbacteria bacterium]|nr:1-(5-phosphoribosyl)-5-[(5-phosphoribosylamino)methylideneamino] imidazole-4-carboxamide isomerase [Candidatus Eisenbacteria bacterium]
MIALPAIDIREGACVQLVGGSYADERVREAEPLAVARRWRAAGFRSLHVVDLDAATGRGDNAAVVAALLAEWKGDCQAGGGLRDEEGIRRVFAAGATRAIVGTRAVEDPAWLVRVAERWPGRILLALDVRGRSVVCRGWERQLDVEVTAFARGLDGVPLAGLLVTAVEREGLERGPDLDVTAAVARDCALPLHASGGISSLDDLRALDRAGASAAVLGMALYTGTLDASSAAGEFGS